MSQAARALHREAGRQEILEAAAAAIARNGFHGMSMRDLSRATGRGLASLYNYFVSKEDLLFALQAGAFTTLIESVEHALAGVAEPQERLYTFVANHVRYVAEHPDVMRVLVHEASALDEGPRAEVRALKERYFGIARDLVRAVVERGCGRPGAGGEATPGEAELERATYALFGMINWVYGWYEPDRHGPPFTVARTIQRIALCGLVARCPVRVDHGAVEACLGEEPPPSPIRASGRPAIPNGGGRE